MSWFANALAVNTESCSSAWYLDIFPSDGVLGATAARSNVAEVCFVLGVSIHILAIVGLDSDVFAIIAICLWADLIDKLCRKRKIFFSRIITVFN